MARSLAVHASAVMIGESGVLIRGAPGTGKSSLALALIETATRQGRFARLIGDDRLMLGTAGSRLVARPHPAIAGMIERRGLGLTPAESLTGGVIRLLVDLTLDETARLPEPEAMVATLNGITLPRLSLGPGPDRTSHVMAALTLFDL